MKMNEKRKNNRQKNRRGNYSATITGLVNKGRRDERRVAGAEQKG